MSARIPGTFRIIHGFSFCAVQSLDTGEKVDSAKARGRDIFSFSSNWRLPAPRLKLFIIMLAPPRRTHYSPSQNGSRRDSALRVPCHFSHGDVAQLPHTRNRKQDLLCDYNSPHFSPSSSPSSTVYGSRNVTLSRRKKRRRCAYKFRGLSCLRKKSACYY